MKVSIIIAAVCLSLSVVSCASLQKDRLSETATDSSLSEIEKLEAMIVPLDALSDADRKPAHPRVAEARKAVKDLELKQIRDIVFEAHLASWSGRLSLIEGNRTEAGRAQSRVEKLGVGIDEGKILQSRLIKDDLERLSFLDEARKGADRPELFDVERGLTLLTLGDNLAAAAAFDSGLAKLPAFYSETYAEKRERAWNLRDLGQGTDSQTAERAAKEKIDWEDVVVLTSTETELFNLITGGEKWNADKLTKALLERKILPSEQTVTRASMARYLWSLNAHRQGKPALLTQYSDRIRTLTNPKSPVPDVYPGDPWFDSVLGCIEWEFMNLEDGRNFNPSGAVKGTDFLRMVKRLR